MNLVVFDIDGTLTRTNEADEACFSSAVAEKFGIPGVVTDWGAYKHSTDSGIIDELLQKHRGRPPLQEELAGFQNLFVSHLEKHYSKNDKSFDSVPGSTQVFELLKKTGTHLVAIATGGWKISAHRKLRKAGISIAQIPAAYADDHFSRDEIVKTAIERARQFYGVSQFQSTTYIGDGRWDFITCNRLNIPFIGVTDTRGKDYLLKEGVERVIDDYSNFETFFRLLNIARP